MRYRKLSPTGDYTFGLSLQNFWIDQIEGVAQAVQTRLSLLEGSWFLDITAGIPWNTKVLGINSAATRDIIIQQQILETQGVTEIVANSYSAVRTGRQLTVSAKVMTIYSTEPVSVVGTL